MNSFSSLNIFFYDLADELVDEENAISTSPSLSDGEDVISISSSLSDGEYEEENNYPPNPIAVANGIIGIFSFHPNKNVTAVQRPIYLSIHLFYNTWYYPMNTFSFLDSFFFII